MRRIAARVLSLGLAEAGAAAGVAPPARHLLQLAPRLPPHAARAAAWARHAHAGAHERQTVSVAAPSSCASVASPSSNDDTAALEHAAASLRAALLVLEGRLALKQGGKSLEPPVDRSSGGGRSCGCSSGGDGSSSSPSAIGGGPPAGDQEALRRLKLRRAVAWSGLAVLCAQWAIFARLTYWDLSWDVVEPSALEVGRGGQNRISHAFRLLTDPPHR